MGRNPGVIKRDADPILSTDELPPATSSLRNLLTVPPIHVDAVGEAICRAVSDQDIEGVMDVRKMRRMLSFDS